MAAYALLYWYEENAWTIQPVTTIVEPKKKYEEVFVSGDFVKAKYSGKAYPGVILHVTENKDHLKTFATKLEILIKNGPLKIDDILVHVTAHFSDSVLASVQVEKAAGLADARIAGVLTKEGACVADAPVHPNRHPEIENVPAPLTVQVEKTSEPAEVTNKVTDVKDVPACLNVDKQKDSVPAPLTVQVEKTSEPAEVTNNVKDVPARLNVDEQKGSTSVRQEEKSHHCHCGHVSDMRKSLAKLQKTLDDHLLHCGSPTSSLLINRTPTRKPAVTVTTPIPSVEVSEDESALLASVADKNGTTDVVCIVQVLARKVFTDDLLKTCSYSGKRSSLSREAFSRPPLDQEKMKLVEKVARLKTGIDRSTFVAKFPKIFEEGQISIKSISNL